MKKIGKKLLVIGSVFLISSSIFAGCKSEEEKALEEFLEETEAVEEETEETEAEPSVEADSSLIDELEAEAENVTLTGEMIENEDLGIKVNCPGTEEDGWSCEKSTYAISATKTVDGFAVGGVVMSVMTMSPSLEDANDFYTGIYKSDEILSKKVTDDYIATYIVLDTYGNLTRKLIYIRELADQKYLQCDADSYLNEENFDHISAEAVKLCLSAENL